MAGFTLIELIIGMVLGIVAVGALFTVYLSSRANFRRDDQIAQVQENARFALDALTRDLQNAGYYGGAARSAMQANVVFAQGTPALVPVSADCGPSGSTTSWLFGFGQSIFFRNQNTTPVVSSFQCLSDVANSIADNTDIVAIKRVSATIDAAGSNGSITFTRNTPATALSLITGSNGGTSTSAMVLQPAALNTAISLTGLTCTDVTGATVVACQPQSGTAFGYRLMPSIYYVRKFTRVAGDNVPALCRRVLATPVSASAPYTNAAGDECVASGVENMQIEWGVGTSSILKDVDHFTSTPLASEFANNLVKSARIFLLMRSAQPFASQWQLTNTGGSSTSGAATRATGTVNDPRTYVMASGDFSSSPDNRSTAGGDSYYRKLYTVTVQLKNSDTS